MPRPAEVFVSLDIEADGPYPGDFSMLSFGAAAYLSNGAPEGPCVTFYRTLDRLPGAGQHAGTMEWWSLHRDAYDTVTLYPEPPGTALRTFARWLEDLPGPPVLVAYPVAYDAMWIQWYLHRFAGRDPFRHAGLDIKTFAMAARNSKRYDQAAKRYWPKRWFDPESSHTHNAIDDAIEQGISFMRMYREFFAEELPQ